MSVSRSAKFLAVACALLGSAGSARAQCGGPLQEAPAVRESLLVSTAWLAAHLRDPDLVLVHVQHMDTSQAQEIPGARVAHAMDWAVGNFDMPPVAALDSLVESLGISNGSRIVVYGDPWVTGWVFLALEYLGADRVAILDGGIEQWRAEGRPTATATAPARATFTAHPRPERVADAAWVNAHLRDHAVAILDARSMDEYTGHVGHRMLPREGHIPGADLVPWESMFEHPAEARSGHATKLLSAAELRALFRRAGVMPGVTPVTYCTVGMRASQMYFVLRYLGYDPRIYDGSMSDWSRRSELPLDTGSTRGNR